MTNKVFIKRAYSAGFVAACEKLAVSEGWVRCLVTSGVPRASEDRLQDFAMRVINPPRPKRMVAYTTAMETPTAQEHMMRVFGPKKPRASFSARSVEHV